MEDRRDSIDSSEKNSLKFRTIPTADGERFFPNSWTVRLSGKNDLKLDSDPTDTLRPRCFFDLCGKITQQRGIYVHLTNEEKEAFELKNLSKELYLYGAYNQSDVVYMRCVGSARRMSKTERKEFLELVKKRLKGGSSPDQLKHDLKPATAKKLSAMLNKGNYYFFSPTAFEYSRQHS